MKNDTYPISTAAHGEPSPKGKLPTSRKGAGEDGSGAAQLDRELPVGHRRVPFARYSDTFRRWLTDMLFDLTYSQARTTG